MAAGAISPELPFVRKQGGRGAQGRVSDARSGVRRRSRRTSRSSTRRSTPRSTSRAAPRSRPRCGRSSAIYGRNVFPEMRLTWGTHPNHIGHEDFLGCFRCHDGNHQAAGGRVITQECDACHQILAQDESNPKVLAELGSSSASRPDRGRPESSASWRPPGPALPSEGVDLSSSYLGLRLAGPVVPGASPLTGDLDSIRRLEDAGAPAVVLSSLFEEQVAAEALGHEGVPTDPDRYLEAGAGREGRRRDPRDRLPERDDRRGVDVVRAARRAGGRGRASS